MNNSHSSQVVQDLERRNQEIMNNISQLKKSTGAGGMLGQGRRRGAGSRGGQQNSTEYASELYHLRSHKDVLEERLLELQETRKDLMIELEELMKILQVQKLGGAGGGVGGPPTHQELSAAAHHFGGGGSYQNMSGEHHNNHEMSHMH